MYLSGLSNVVLKSWSRKKVEGKDEALQSLCNLGLWEQNIPAKAWAWLKARPPGRFLRAHLSSIAFMRVVGIMDQLLLFHPVNSRQLEDTGIATSVRHSNTFFLKFLVPVLNIFHKRMAVFLYTLGTPITLLVSLFLLFPEAELLTGAQCSPREGRINWSQSEPCHLCGAAGLNWSYYQWHPPKAPAPHPWPLTFPLPFYGGNS